MTILTNRDMIEWGLFIMLPPYVLAARNRREVRAGWNLDLRVRNYKRGGEILAIGKYETYVKPKLFLVEMWARDGLTDEQIAHNLGIAVASFYNYKNDHIEFLEALKKGKEVADYEVENALFNKALGYNATVRKAFKVKEVLYENGKRLKETERIEYADEEIHIPADTTAQIFWLKNRRPDKWRDKQETETKINNGVLDELTEYMKTQITYRGD